MKIKTVTFQHRNDFSAVLVCEHCGGEQVLGGGYDDTHYHKHVLPSIRCVHCALARDAITDHAAAEFTVRRVERFLSCSTSD